jgi:hypothetical protein
MAVYCIPRKQIDKMKKVLSKISSDNQIQKLADFSSKKRTELFEKVLTPDEAKLLNKEFEKAVASKKVSALRNWVKNNLDKEYRKDEMALLNKKFKNADEVNAYIDSRVDLLAEKKEGVALTNAQVKKFSELGQTFYDKTKKLGNYIGEADKVKENIEWGKALRDLQMYREDLLPRSWWGGLMQKLGRVNMLASIKTPFLNIESNTINGITEAISRRFGTWQLTKSVDRKIAKDYVKFARKMFKETGVDFTRMIDVDDTVVGVGKIVGEKSDKVGVEALDKYADFIFNKTLSGPDVAFSSFAFTDSLSLGASKLAKGNKAKANKLFKEATNINATGEAKMLREQAIADARMATYTNDSYSSKISESIRKTLNKVGGLGDITLPFIKTPANVAELGADYSGLGFIKAAKPTFAVGKAFIKGQKVDREAMRSAFTNIARSGLGMTAAFGLASRFNVEDFMGVYDPDRIKYDQLSNTAYNAILIDTPIGKRWVNVDYLGPIANPFVSFMYAKKYGKEGYIGGATSQYLNQLPFIEAKGIFEGLDILADPDGTSKRARLFKTIKKNVGNTISARLTPGIMYDLARATDEVQRDTYQDKFIVKTPFFEMNFDKFINKVPYFRKDLPIKHDALGRVMYESSPIESLMFGARVRTARMDEITSEIYRLRDNGQQPNIKDLRFMYSSKVDELKEKTGDKFYDVARKYGEDLATEFEKEMAKSKYKNASDEEKKDMLYDVGQDLYVKTLKKNGVKYR